MNKSRLEAFSDGVIAIIITILVLDLKIPLGADLASLKPVFPVFLTYILSFVFLGIYWNNHHHMLHAASRINGKVLWANLHLLFWLSIIPFTTGWMGENHFEPLPTALYGVVLLMAAVGYTILLRCLIEAEGQDSKLAQAVGKDSKGLLSLVCYAAAIPLSFIAVWIAWALYVAVALIWMVPDTRIESRVGGN